ncbi:TPA: hypothetical protein N0F65_011221 [Lagenidium giganteum]|uniref:Uncharacterized protein n=1 Tax=Lagenidium giganteum TaxID=4803 RepID=A0AAV2YTI1_9STRA|nr:TPA: hypothetical protein N0F65_011221 [Lagenidium giganteum]
MVLPRCRESAPKVQRFLQHSKPSGNPTIPELVRDAKEVRLIGERACQV